MIPAGILRAVTAAGLVWVLAGCAGDSPAPSTAERSAAETPADGVQSPDGDGARNADTVALPDELTPEALVQLTPAELTDRFAIKAAGIASPEDYALAFTQRYVASRMAGCTEEELARYESEGRGPFEQAMIAKYHQPVSQGLYGYEIDDNNFHVGLNRCLVLAVGDDVYEQNADLLPSSVVTVVRPDGSFDISFDIRTWDNYAIVKESIGDVDGSDSLDYTSTWGFSNVHPDPDGVLYADSITDVKVGG